MMELTCEPCESGVERMIRFIFLEVKHDDR